jgi:hypothetical protein
MRENRPSGSEGGAAQLNAPSLPLSVLTGVASRKREIFCRSGVSAGAVSSFMRHRLSPALPTDLASVSFFMRHCDRDLYDTLMFPGLVAENKVRRMKVLNKVWMKMDGRGEGPFWVESLGALSQQGPQKGGFFPFLFLYPKGSGSGCQGEELTTAGDLTTFSSPQDNPT